MFLKNILTYYKKYKILSLQKYLIHFIFLKIIGMYHSMFLKNLINLEILFPMMLI